MIGWVIEAFIEEIATKAHELSQDNGDTKINPSHIKEVIMEDSKTFGFLKSCLTDVPDLQKRVNTAKKSSGYISRLEAAANSEV